MSEELPRSLWGMPEGASVALATASWHATGKRQNGSWGLAQSARIVQTALAMRHFCTRSLGGTSDHAERFERGRGAAPRKTSAVGHSQVQRNMYPHARCKRRTAGSSRAIDKLIPSRPFGYDQV